MCSNFPQTDLNVLSTVCLRKNRLFPGREDRYGTENRRQRCGGRRDFRPHGSGVFPAEPEIIHEYQHIREGRKGFPPEPFVDRLGTVQFQRVLEIPHGHFSFSHFIPDLFPVSFFDRFFILSILSSIFPIRTDQYQLSDIKNAAGSRRESIQYISRETDGGSLPAGVKI